MSDFPIRLVTNNSTTTSSSSSTQSNVTSSSSTTPSPSLSHQLHTYTLPQLELLFQSHPTLYEQISVPDTDGRTPFQWAVAGSQYDTLHYLLHNPLIIQSNVINLPDIYTGITPLMTAVSTGNLQIIQLLLDNGADPNLQIPPSLTKQYMNHDSDSSDHDIQSSLSTTKSIRKIPTLLKNQTKGTSILHYHKGNIAIVKLLIPLLSLPCINSHENINGSTPLHRACGPGYTEVAEYLLNHGANINEIDNYGNTSLHYAIEENQIAIVKLLCDYHADINIKNHEHKSPMDLLSLKTVSEEIKSILHTYRNSLSSSVASK